MWLSFSGHRQMSLPGGPQMNKFEQVSSNCHQMAQGDGARSRGVPGLMSRGGGCTVRFNALWVMVTWDPLWTDRHRHMWKYYLPTTSLAGGKYSFWCKKKWSTRMHSSRMHTIHCSGHLGGEGVSAQGCVCLPRGVCVCPGCVSA